MPIKTKRYKVKIYFLINDMGLFKKPNLSIQNTSLGREVT